MMQFPPATFSCVCCHLQSIVYRNRGSILRDMWLRCTYWPLWRARRNQTDSVRVTYHWGAFLQPSFRRKNNEWHIFWVCVCSLGYPALQSACAMLYCHLWAVRLYRVVFPHYLTHSSIFRNKTLWTQNVRFDFNLIFSINLHKISL